MHVFNRYTQIFQVQIFACEIPQSAHAMLYKLTRKRGCDRMRYGQNRNIRLMLIDIRIQFGYVTHGHAVHAAADDHTVTVKRTQQFKSIALKAEILNKRSAQVAHTDEYRGVRALESQNVLQPFAQLFDAVSIALLAKTTSFQTNIQIDKVADYQDFVTQLQRDHKFERLIQSMTVDRLAGGGSLAKYKYHF